MNHVSNRNSGARRMALKATVAGVVGVALAGSGAFTTASAQVPALRRAR